MISLPLPCFPATAILKAGLTLMCAPTIWRLRRWWLQAIVTNLIDGGYNGFFDVELMGEDLGVADYRDLLVQSKHIVEGLLAHAQN